MSLIHHLGTPAPEQYPHQAQSYGIPAAVPSQLQFMYPPAPTVLGNSITQNGWNHQTPSQMPWSVPPPTTQQIVKFQGEPSNPNLLATCPPPGTSNWWQTPRIDFTDTTSYRGSSGLNKRKIDLFTDGPSRKQLITDEKMAAELDRLHISLPESKRNGASLSLQNDDSLDRTSKRIPTLILSEELKRLQQEPLIPPSLLESYNKPSLAIVLWKPPGGGLQDLLTNNTTSESDEDKEEEKQSPEPQQQMEEDPAVLDMENNNNISYIDYDFPS